MRRLLIAGVAAAALFAFTTTGASAGGLTQAQLEDAGWTCGPPAGPPGHCFGPGAGGTQTFVILVFDETGQFATAESGSFHPGADARPCPHDPEADPDGTWWSPFLRGEPAPEGLFVCHHR